MNSHLNKIMFEIYKESSSPYKYRVVYFSELDEHNRDQEIDRAMNGDHYFDGFIASLKKERAMKKISNIIDILNKGEMVDVDTIKDTLKEVLVS